MSGRMPGSIIAEEAIKGGSILTVDMVKEGSGMLAIMMLEDL